MDQTIKRTIVAQTAQAATQTQTQRDRSAIPTAKDKQDPRQLHEEDVSKEQAN